MKIVATRASKSLAAVSSVRECEMVKQMLGRSQLSPMCCEPLAILWAQGGKGLEAHFDIRDALVAGFANRCREREASLEGLGTHTMEINIDPK